MSKQPSATKFTHTTASVLLDLVRGLAAVLVLSEHWRNVLFVDYPQVSAWASHAFARLAWAVAYLVTSAGHQAVMVFFVLSGYLISGSVFRMFERGQWSWRVYLMHRLARLWVVLLPGLLLCALWDTAGLHSGRAMLSYHGVGPNHMTADVSRTLTAKIFAANLFFLQPMTTPVFGSDGALWSLPFEFWYYMLFPLAAIALRRGTRPAARLVHGVLFCAAVWFVRGGVLVMFPVWLLGTLLAILPAVDLPAWVRWLATMLYLPAMLIASKLHRWNDVYEDWGFAVITAVFLWLMLSARARSQEQSLWVRGSRGLSRFSYTLYVVHTPLLLLVAAFVVGDGRWLPTPLHVAAALAILALLLVYAWAVASVTEFRTDRVRGWVERLLWRRAEAPTAHEALLKLDRSRTS